MTPVIIELAVLSLLSVCWLTLHGQLVKNVSHDVFHVAHDRQAIRKAKFYYQSVWLGILSAFLCARLLEALAGASFDSGSQKAWVMGSLRGVEMWGLLITAGVWTLVGRRVSKPNSDGRSLIAVEQAETTRTDRDRD